MVRVDVYTSEDRQAEREARQWIKAKNILVTILIWAGFILFGFYVIGTLFYSLPGSIPCVQCSSTGTTVGRPSYNNPNPDPIFYPNPATSSVKLKYQLPKDYKSAIIKVQDLQGRLVEEYKVTNDFDLIYIPSEFNNGLYFYSLIVDGKLIKTEKIILSK